MSARNVKIIMFLRSKVPLVRRVDNLTGDFPDNVRALISHKACYGIALLFFYFLSDGDKHSEASL
jgi:hypothetical protein